VGAGARGPLSALVDDGAAAARCDPRCDRCLADRAERAPMLMAWEDLHWADPTTLEALGMLIEQAPTAALLVVATYRPELTPPWPQRSHMTPITLNRLERPEVETMIGHLSGGRSLPGE